MLQKFKDNYMKEMKLEPLKNPKQFENSADKLNIDVIEDAINTAVCKVKQNIIKLGYEFPSASTSNGLYKVTSNDDWTNGFWTGILWLCYENTHESVFKNLALKNIKSFGYRLKNNIVLNHHDLGFLYSPSCVAGYKLIDDNEAKSIAIKAADKLCTRYNVKGKFIQAWGKVGAIDNYRLIVDSLLNIPLLFWAFQVTNDDKYLNIATNHLNTTLHNVIRQDGSTYHTYFFDPITGFPLYGKTRQGYSDDSSWARGQAWLIYGLALNLRYLNEYDGIHNIFNGVTNYFLNRLPKDLVSFWDLIFTDGNLQARDSSATAIAICGIDQMSKIYPNSSYDNAKKAMMKSLIQNYTDTWNSNGIIPLINHGTYSWHDGKGIDEGNIWGDYFYLEALTRIKNPSWNPYWI